VSTSGPGGGTKIARR